MATEATNDVGAIDEIVELERRVTELRVARAQMVAEREEHAREAARAATVLDGLAQIHREFGILTTERAEARDAAVAACDAANDDVARIRRATDTAETTIRDLEARLAIAHETATRVARGRADAESAYAEAVDARDHAMANYDETARAAADVAAKYEVAIAEATIAEGRDVQFTDIEETLDREQSLAETRLRDARGRAETTQVEAELRRIRVLEDRLARERADLERRLRAMRSSIVVPPLPKSARYERSGAPGPLGDIPPAPRREGPEPEAVSLAARLQRDLGARE